VLVGVRPAAARYVLGKHWSECRTSTLVLGVVSVRTELDTPFFLFEDNCSVSGFRPPRSHTLGFTSTASCLLHIEQVRM